MRPDVHRELLDGLKKVGFRTNMGIEGTGPLFLVFTKGGGHIIGL